MKINKEIRNYTESIFFGLSFRQFFFSVCSCIVVVIIYFSFKDIFNKEVVSWICIFGAIPFIGFGFFKYNGLFLENFILAFIKSEFLVPRELKFISTNFYYDSVKRYLENREREGIKKKC